MTPDEVVKQLKLSIEKDCACRACMTIPFAISLISDYQKLRERLSVEKIEGLITPPKGQMWLIDTLPIAQAIVTYLQQPTEHIVR
jgi:hypothetical protein